jgi:hypothetical protein
LKQANGNYIVVCPNANKPGIHEKAELNISKYQARRRQNARNNKKRKNVNTVHWEDIPEKQRKVILAQAQRRSQVGVSSLDAISVALTLTGTITNSIICLSNVIFHQDIVILATQSFKPQIPIAIHSLMPHLMLQTGGPKEEKDCPALQFMLDSGASLSTANFHCMEAVIKQYPHILKAIYLPNDYAAIILSGIVTTPDEAPVTMELSVGFEIFLPYLTKDRNETSLLVAAGLDVAVNLILSLPFIEATGMIADFVNNVCQAKHLLSDPFPINFRRTMKSIPAIGTCDSASDCAKYKKVHQVLGLLNAYFANKQPGRPLHLIVPLSANQGFSASSPKKISFGSHWRRPTKSTSDVNDYQHQVLGDLGYL